MGFLRSKYEEEDTRPLGSQILEERHHVDGPYVNVTVVVVVHVLPLPSFWFLLCHPERYRHLDDTSSLVEVRRYLLTSLPFLRVRLVPLVVHRLQQRPFPLFRVLSPVLRVVYAHKGDYPVPVD